MPQERGILIDLKSNLAPSLAPVMGAENEIRDALTKLVLNAVDAMPEGGPLTLRTRAVAGGSVGDANSVRTWPWRSLTRVWHGRGVPAVASSRSSHQRRAGDGTRLAMVYGMVQPS